MDQNQIKQLLEQAIGELGDIRNIRESLYQDEKALQVTARLLAIEMLEEILKISKGEKVASTKDKLFYLPKNG